MHFLSHRITNEHITYYEVKKDIYRRKHQVIIGCNIEHGNCTDQQIYQSKKKVEAARCRYSAV